MNVIKHARIALKHFAPGVALSAAVLFGSGQTAHAQPSVTFTTTALPTTAASTGAEILNTGTLVAANHFGNGGQTAITLANGLAFGTSTAHLVPLSSWNHNASDSGIATIANPAFNQLINSRWWIAYTDSRSDMVIPNLVIGNTYRLQLISVEPNAGTVSVEGSPEYIWANSISVLSATWTAEDTTLNMQYSRKQQASPGGQGGEVRFNGYALHDITVPASLKTILSFTFPGLGAATITGTNIALTVPYGTPVTNLAPTYTVSVNATGTPLSGTSMDFSSSKTCIVTAQDSSTRAYRVTVNVTPISTAKDILACDFGALGAAVISGTNVLLTVAPNQTVTNLAPTFSVSPFATLSPASGSTNDFTNPVTYTVTAQNGTTKAYSVAVQSYAAWSNSASLYLLTTTNGANLPASASEANFPVLVRLNSGNFNFSQARSNGTDLRFTLATGAALSYQIEEWNPTNGTASIWVKIPLLKGNTNQELKMYWGKTDAPSESSGTNVFSSANGYVSVIHLNETLQDEAGSITPVNSGTTLATGMIGKGRHIDMGKGINCGDSIANYPYSGNPFTSECWFRAAQGGTTILYWGRYATRYNGPTGDGNEVGLQFGSPASLYWESDGPGGATAATTPALGQWHHIAATYSNGTSRIFVNGKLDGSNTGGSSAMSLYTNIQMKIGGMRGGYAYAGDVDEVRVSKVARSTNWMWLQYQNQNPLQTLVGPPVQSGGTFSVIPASVTMNEGAVTNVTGQAGGAQKLYWIYKKNGQETVLAVDQFTLGFGAGRVVGDQSFVLQFKAICPTGIKTNDIPVTINEYIPDPVFTLTAPATWDGRQTITVTPNISNWSDLQARGVTNFTYTWSVAGVAVIKQIAPGTLTLLRSQGRGPMTVTLVLDNGGAMITNTTTITVQEPSADAWVVRTPATNEIPVNGQFYARDNTGFATIHYNGTLSQTGTNVYLKVYTNGPSGDVLYTSVSQALPLNKLYALSARIAPGLVKYKVEFGYISGGSPTLVGTVTNLLCGDAYIIDGQSNAVADSNDSPYGSYSSDWIRSFGTMGGGNAGGWCNAVAPSAGGRPGRIGYWGVVLASNLLASYNIPICIINDSVGGTLISQHQANPTNHYDTSPTYSIYGSILNRVAAAKLTHGIRGVLWHQGENNSGAAAPTGDWDYKSYQQYFVDMSAAWKQDYPNIQHYYVYQVWPLPCGMGPKGDQLREAQRTLPRLYSNMGIMSTIGVTESWGTRGLCHFDGAGYMQLANLMAPLVKQDNYGLVPSQPITAPDLKGAWFTTTNRNEIALEFGQAMAWNSAATVNLYLNRVAGKVSSGSASGNVIKLQLTGASTAQTIDYLEDAIWDGNSGSLLRGSNGIAALTFADVFIAPPTYAPAITSLSPTSGRTNGGTVVTLTGSNFLSGATVQFGGLSATAATVNSSTQVTATTPAHGAGLVSVTLLNTNGLSATNQFTYMLPPPPATLGGVGQSGTNLVMLWLGGTNQPCVLLSATNVAQARHTWTPVATNAVGPNGRFTNSIPVKPADPQRFYLLSIPYS